MVYLPSLVNFLEHGEPHAHLMTWLGVYRAHTTGILRSEVFPGLWLDSQALLTGDLLGMLTVLQKVVTTPEHPAFATEL